MYDGTIKQRKYEEEEEEEREREREEDKLAYENSKRANERGAKHAYSVQCTVYVTLWTELFRTHECRR